MSAAKKSVSKVVLAYSGGLDTSCIVPWLVENYDCEVICFCANLGQEEELAGLEEKALQSGASKLYVEDLREEFITDYIYPTLKAGAIYEHVLEIEPGNAETHYQLGLVHERAREPGGDPCPRRPGSTRQPHPGPGDLRRS